MYVKFEFETGVNLKMPKAYSEDLRWRAVWLNLVKGMTYTEVAEVLFMCEKSVYRYLSQFHATGSVEPKEPSGDQTKGLSEFESFTVLHFTTQQYTLRKSSRICMTPLVHGYTFQPSVAQSRSVDSPERRYSLLLSSRVRQNGSSSCLRSLYMTQRC